MGPEVPRAQGRGTCWRRSGTQAPAPLQRRPTGTAALVVTAALLRVPSSLQLEQPSLSYKASCSRGVIAPQRFPLTCHGEWGHTASQSGSLPERDDTPRKAMGSVTKGHLGGCGRVKGAKLEGDVTSDSGEFSFLGKEQRFSQTGIFFM